ncbi:MAG TPA: 23S rRNA (guanosine(2251)-2'-O)-methyltransferase RlmB [Chitinophagales bacterium]|nr:23S rRNA (guanosine(2251)-2'-O)-methyltransferase RlmB [Chitinophagales bacterium]
MAALQAQLIFGRHPIIEALQNGQTFDRIYVQQGIHPAFIKQLRGLAEIADVDVQTVPVEKLNRLTRQNHQGVAGFTALITYHEVGNIVQQAYELGQTPLLVICDGITDVGNFGAIARTAAGAGVHGLVITRKGSAPVNADAIKASAGALNKLPVCRVRFIDKTIPFLQEMGLQVIAADGKAKTLLQQIDFKQPTAIIMGAEDEGVSPAHLALCDKVFKIPMPGNFDSFNVSVATGMVLYEAIRQK